MRLTPKMKYATAPTSGTSQTKPTHAIAARESRLRKMAWPDASTDIASASPATPTCQTSRAACHVVGAEIIRGGHTPERGRKEGGRSKAEINVRPKEIRS